MRKLKNLKGKLKQVDVSFLQESSVKWMSVRQYAKTSGVSTTTIYNWVYSGALDAVCFEGKVLVNSWGRENG